MLKFVPIFLFVLTACSTNGVSEEFDASYGKVLSHARLAEIGIVINLEQRQDCIAVQVQVPKVLNGRNFDLLEIVVGENELVAALRITPDRDSNLTGNYCFSRKILERSIIYLSYSSSNGVKNTHVTYSTSLIKE